MVVVVVVVVVARASTTTTTTTTTNDDDDDDDDDDEGRSKRARLVSVLDLVESEGGASGSFDYLPRVTDDPILRFQPESRSEGNEVKAAKC